MSQRSWYTWDDVWYRGDATYVYRHAKDVARNLRLRSKVAIATPRDAIDHVGDDDTEKFGEIVLAAFVAPRFSSV